MVEIRQIFASTDIELITMKDAGVKVVAKGGHVIKQSAILMVAPDEKISISVSP